MATFNTILGGPRGGMPNGLIIPNPAVVASGPLYNGSRARAEYIKSLEAAIAHLSPGRKVPIGGFVRRSSHTSADTWRLKVFPEPFVEFCQVRMIVRFESATPATASCSFNVTGLTTVALPCSVFETTRAGAELLVGIFELDSGTATRAVREIAITSAIANGTLTFHSVTFWPERMAEITTV